MDTAQDQEKIVETPITPQRTTEKDLFVWTEKSRPFKRRTREYYVTLFAIVGLIGFVLFIAEGAMPVILLVSVVFLFYVLSNVEPIDVEYKITNLGIKIAGRRTDWSILGRFWFTEKLGSSILIIETFTLPGRLEMVVKAQDVEKIREILTEYLTEEEIPQSQLEKATNWFSSKLPGN